MHPNTDYAQYILVRHKAHQGVGDINLTDAGNRNMFLGDLRREAEIEFGDKFDSQEFDRVALEYVIQGEKALLPNQPPQRA